MRMQNYTKYLNLRDFFFSAPEEMPKIHFTNKVPTHLQKLMFDCCSFVVQSLFSD